MSTTTLYCKEGGSDKIYQASLKPHDGGWTVTFAFGRRGSTLSTGTKTPQPLPEEPARRIYEKLIQSKLAKGYTVGEDATPYVDSGKTVTSIRPQLLNPVTRDDIEPLLRNDDIAMQEKFDGRRLLLRKQDGTVTGINRRGIECGIPETIRNAAFALPGNFLLDGEAVGDILHVFDLLEEDAEDLRPLPYRSRIIRMMNLLAQGQQSAIRCVRTELGESPKRRAFTRLLRNLAEGVVFKNLAAPYTSGRPASGGDQLKCKFVESASVIVQSVNAKRSVAIAVRYGERLVSAGNVTIPVNHPVPPDGSIVEVQYLYATPSGALFQPVYLGVRDDIDAAECTRDQLKFRREEVAA